MFVVVVLVVSESVEQQVMTHTACSESQSNESALKVKAQRAVDRASYSARELLLLDG